MKIPQVHVEIGCLVVRITADYHQRCVNVEAQQYGDGDNWCYVCCCLFKHGPQQMAKELLLCLFGVENLDQLSVDARPCYKSLCDLLTIWLVLDRDLHMWYMSATGSQTSPDTGDTQC